MNRAREEAEESSGPHDPLKQCSPTSFSAPVEPVLLFPHRDNKPSGVAAIQRTPHGRNRPLFGRWLSHSSHRVPPFSSLRASCNLHIYVEARIDIDIEYEHKQVMNTTCCTVPAYYLCMRPHKAAWRWLYTLTRHSRCTAPLPISSTSCSTSTSTTKAKLLEISSRPSESCPVSRAIHPTCELP